MEKKKGLRSTERIVKQIKRKILNLMKFPEQINIGLLSRKKNGLLFHMNDIMRIYEKNTDEYMSYYRRPKYPEQIVSVEEPTDALRNSAIIMQGPLMHIDDFTFETVRFYDKIFPGAVVIISTWENEDKTLIERLEALDNCIVVLNQYPSCSGVLNVNYQVTSTLGGIKKARELGKIYSWKTRCDYRFYRKGSIDYMVEIMDLFPVDVKADYQTKRIVCGAGHMYRAWWVMDQFSFGLTEDMYQYWNYTLVNKNIKTVPVFNYLEKNHVTWNDRVRKNLAAETSIVLDYFKRMEGRCLDVTVKEYWEKLRENYIILSCEELNPYWVKDEYGSKYDEAEIRHIYIRGDTSDKLNSCMWDFQKWIALYRGKLVYRKEFEKIGEKNTY